MHNKDLKNLNEVITWLEQVAYRTEHGTRTPNNPVVVKILERQRAKINSLKNIENAIRSMCQSIETGFGSASNEDLYLDHGQWAVNLKSWAESFSGVNDKVTHE